MIKYSTRTFDRVKESQRTLKAFTELASAMGGHQLGFIQEFEVPDVPCMNFCSVHSSFSYFEHRYLSTATEELLLVSLRTMGFFNQSYFGRNVLMF